MINIDFINYFVEFTKTENLTKASESLHISQSALTRAMYKLEDYVGVPLFNRSANRITLTDTGKEFKRRAENFLEQEKDMVSGTVAFYNSSLSLLIGSVAPGPFLKYGNLIYSLFGDKTISNKIDEKENLISGLKDGKFDFIFLSEEFFDNDIASTFAFTEKLYFSLPDVHPAAALKSLSFAEMNGQPFLVAKNLGLWDKMIHEKMPSSRFFSQNLDDLETLITSSSIPGFATNVSIPTNERLNRINVPVKDKEANVDFYLCYKKKDQKKLSALIRSLND